MEWHNFKEKMGLKRKTFKVTLEKISPQIELIPTNVKPNPKSTHHQIYTSSSTIYRLEIIRYFYKTSIVKFFEIF